MICTCNATLLSSPFGALVQRVSSSNEEISCNQTILSFHIREGSFSWNKFYTILFSMHNSAGNGYGEVHISKRTITSIKIVHMFLLLVMVAVI